MGCGESTEDACELASKELKELYNMELQEYGDFLSMT